MNIQCKTYLISLHAVSVSSVSTGHLSLFIPGVVIQHFHWYWVNYTSVIGSGAWNFFGQKQLFSANFWAQKMHIFKFWPFLGRETVIMCEEIYISHSVENKKIFIHFAYLIWQIAIQCEFCQPHPQLQLCWDELSFNFDFTRPPPPWA